MIRTPLLTAVPRSFQAARFCDRNHIPTREGSGNGCFAGEHANSFYEWQGFMEGAALAGIAAASAILA